MKLGLLAGYSGRHINIPLDAIKHAETLGYDSVWTSEAYGSDAVTPAAWILANTTKIKVGTAIMQMPARTPAMAAMTAMTLAQLSGNRFIVGVGASGPQVVEGWHGVAYGQPVTRLKEYVADHAPGVRAREALSFDGKEYQIPYRGPGSYRARQAAQEHPALRAADPDLCRDADAGRRAGGGRSGGRLLPGVDGPGAVPRVPGADREGLQGGRRRQDARAVRHRAVRGASTWATTCKACMAPMREHMALYIGGMGAKDKNFYTDYATRLGFGDAARKVQDLYLAGKQGRSRGRQCPTRWSTPAIWSVRRRAFATGCSAGSRPARRVTSAAC